MAVKKFAISFEPELADQVRESAMDEGRSMSSWLAEAAQEQLRSRALRTYVDEYEREHGAFTPEELAEADRFWPA